MASRNNENIPVLTPYNPLGEQVAESLLEQDVQPLPPSRFISASVICTLLHRRFPDLRRFDRSQQG